jgi:CBS domain-containing protein
MLELVKDVMTRSVISVPHDAVVDVAIDIMLNKNVSGVPVVDEQHHLLGLITEFDVLQLFGADDASLRYAPCEQFMTRAVKSVQENAPVEVAAKIFKAAAIRRLLVLSGEELVGILSRRDVLRCIYRQRNAATPG